jgi:hypothetical protein
MTTTMHSRGPAPAAVIERAEISPHQIHREHHEIADFIVFDAAAGKGPTT